MISVPLSHPVPPPSPPQEEFISLCYRVSASGHKGDSALQVSRSSPLFIICVRGPQSDFDYSVSKVRRPGIAWQRGQREKGPCSWDGKRPWIQEARKRLSFLWPTRVQPLRLEYPQLIYKPLSVFFGGEESTTLRKYSKMSLPSKANKSRAEPRVSDLSLWNSPL